MPYARVFNEISHISAKNLGSTKIWVLIEKIRKNFKFGSMARKSFQALADQMSTDWPFLIYIVLKKYVIKHFSNNALTHFKAPSLSIE